MMKRPKDKFQDFTHAELVRFAMDSAANNIFLQKELEAVKDDADTWRRVSESLQLDVKSLKELAINAANQLELYHPESDIADQLEELL